MFTSSKLTITCWPLLDEMNYDVSVGEPAMDGMQSVSVLYELTVHISGTVREASAYDLHHVATIAFA